MKLCFELIASCRWLRRNFHFGVVAPPHFTWSRSLRGMPWNAPKGMCKTTWQAAATCRVPSALWCHVPPLLLLQLAHPKSRGTKRSITRRRLVVAAAAVAALAVVVVVVMVMVPSLVVKLHSWAANPWPKAASCSWSWAGEISAQYLGLSRAPRDGLSPCSCLLDTYHVDVQLISDFLDSSGIWRQMSCNEPVCPADLCQNTIR